MGGKKLTVALIGNPNVGKTTVFNSITGARQHVGNWPGVTVEKKEGQRAHRGIELKVVDLPGTYSLTAYSQDEIVSRDFILEERPDVVVDIIDATNLERNLYLTTQLMEMGVRLVIALNMYDMVEASDDEIDVKRLKEFLEIPVVRTVGSQEKGISELLDEVVTEAQQGEHHEHTIGYGKSIEANISEIERTIREDRDLCSSYNPRWLSIKLLEGDSDIQKRISKSKVSNEISLLMREMDTDTLEAEMADKRYDTIASVIRQVQRKGEIRLSASDMIDRVFTNKYLGIPIFLILIWGAFELTFTFATPFMDAIDVFFGWLADLVSDSVDTPWLASLLADGLIGGVGFVLVFVPTIFILFLIISILEDSGYLARAAFLMDRLMYNMGLQGKSFIPLIMGFGCNVPAIMATRSIEEKNDRLITILINPFISCGARLPVYLLLAGAFFGRDAGVIIFILYVMGLGVAILSAKLFRMTILKGSPAPFIMELPPYRLPTVKGSLIHMWGPGSLYLKKAGTFILVGAIVIWGLSYFNTDGFIEESTKEINGEVVIGSGVFEGSGSFSGEGDFHGMVLEDVTLVDGNSVAAFTNFSEDSPLEMGDGDSLIGNGTFEGHCRFEGNGTYTGSDFVTERSFTADIGHALEPVTEPLGFDWRMNTALVYGFVAKEVVVESLGILYGVGEDDEALTDSIKDDESFSPLVAFCLMVFTLVYIPCIATVAVIKKETRSWRWTSFSVGYGLTLAWILVFIIYNVGSFLGY